MFIPPVLSDELQAVSITDGGTQFISVHMNKNIIYSYSSSIPQNGVMIFSLPDNDTYMVNSGDIIEMVTVSKKSTSTNIIDMILGWL
jgi:hypothetical protein